MNPPCSLSLASDLGQAGLIITLCVSVLIGETGNNNNEHLSQRAVVHIIHIRDLIGLILVTGWLLNECWEEKELRKDAQISDLERWMTSKNLTGSRWYILLVKTIDRDNPYSMA